MPPGTQHIQSGFSIYVFVQLCTHRWYKRTAGSGAEGRILRKHSEGSVCHFALLVALLGTGMIVDVFGAQNIDPLMITCTVSQEGSVEKPDNSIGERGF